MQSRLKSFAEKEGAAAGRADKRRSQHVAERLPSGPDLNQAHSLHVSMEKPTVASAGLTEADWAEAKRAERLSQNCGRAAKGPAARAIGAVCLCYLL